MAFAEPDQTLWGGLRQGSQNKIRVSIRYPDRYIWKHPYRMGMERVIHPIQGMIIGRCTFTLQSSGLCVGRGRLGEVVSLVGDCRPPPPGNPRRPTRLRIFERKYGGWRSGKVVIGKRGGGFTATMGKPGEIYTSIEAPSSLYKLQVYNNLKESNTPQNFKKIYSYSSCIRGEHVLEFLHLHSHLCGLKVVEPPPIAITNVLRTG
jgi:hypothetical protein